MKIPTLHDRVLQGAADKIHRFLQRYLEEGITDNVNAYDEKGQTPLILATKISRADLVEIFLTFEGTDLNKPERESGIASFELWCVL